MYVLEVDWKACAKWLHLPEEAHEALKTLFHQKTSNLQLHDFIQNRLKIQEGSNMFEGNHIVLSFIWNVIHYV